MPRVDVLICLVLMAVLGAILRSVSTTDRSAIGWELGHLRSAAVVFLASSISAIALSFLLIVWWGLVAGLLSRIPGSVRYDLSWWDELLVYASLGVVCVLLLWGLVRLAMGTRFFEWLTLQMDALAVLIVIELVRRLETEGLRRDDLIKRLGWYSTLLPRGGGEPGPRDGDVNLLQKGEGASSTQVRAVKTSNLLRTLNRLIPKEHEIEVLMTELVRKGVLAETTDDYLYVAKDLPRLEEDGVVRPVGLWDRMIKWNRRGYEFVPPNQREQLKAETVGTSGG